MQRLKFHDRESSQIKEDQDRAASGRCGRYQGWAALGIYAHSAGWAGASLAGKVPPGPLGRSGA